MLSYNNKLNCGRQSVKPDKFLVHFSRTRAVNRCERMQTMCTVTKNKHEYIFHVCL